MTFNGFISYSHAVDGRLAPAVQRGLHRLAKPWHRRRALWIFRDQTGLAVTPRLWSSIQNALDDSEYFVLLASPEAARSPWVNREIEHWIATKSVDHILPVVTEGEWTWDAERGDFTDDSTAVPSALQGVFTEEPFFLDLRWARGSEHLSLQHSRFRDAIARLAAPMHGISSDELEGDDVRQHRRARRLRAGAVVTLVVLALLASLTGMSAVRNAERAKSSLAEAMRQQQVAADQRDIAERAAAEARRQEELAREQQDRAARAAAAADEAERKAREQQKVADEAAAEARRQQRLADQATTRTREQQRLAEAAAERAEREKKEAVRLARIAAEQRRLADVAAADALKQQRIAVSRRLMNQAGTLVAEDPKTALMLGAAAEELNPDTTTQRQLTGVVTSTNYAGTIGDMAFAEYAPGGLLLTLGKDGRVSLWNVADPGRPVRITTLPDKGATGTAPEISRNGRTLAMVDASGKAVLWDLANRSRPARLATLPTAGPVTAMTFGQDGITFVTGEASGNTTVWDVTERTRPAPLATMRVRDQMVKKVVLSPNGRILIVDQSPTRTGYDLTDRADPVEVEMDLGLYGPFAFSPDGSSLAHGVDGRVTIYPLDQVFLGPAARVSVALDDDDDDPVPPPMPTFEPDPDDDWNPPLILHGEDLWGQINALAFSADGNQLVVADEHGGAEVWDRRLQRASRFYTGVRARSPITEVSFDADAATMVTADTSGTTTLWNVAPPGAPDPLTMVVGPSGYNTATAFTPDGPSLIAAGTRGTANTWDITNPGRPVRGADLTLHSGNVDVLTFSPDGRTVAARDSATGEVTLADTGRPDRTTTVTTPPRGSWAPLVFSPDGRTLAVAYDSTTLTLWNVADRTHPTQLGKLTVNPDAYGIPLAFSRDGRLLAAGNAGNTIALWNVADRTAPVQLATMAGHSGDVGALAFSPDGRTLVSGSDDRTAIVWDITDRVRPQRLVGLTGHGSRVLSVAFNPDGRTLATGDDLGRLMLWDATEPAVPVQIADVIGVFRVLPDREYSQVRRLTFRNDGRTLAVTGQFQGVELPTISLWDYRDLNRLRADPARYACSTAGRGLTAAEWARFIPELRYQRTCPR